MSYKVLETVLDNGPADMTETLVLVAIAENASDAGYAFPGIPTIAHRSRCCERHVIRIIKKLAMDGWLVILPRREGPSKKQTAYQMNLQKLSNHDSHAIQIAHEKALRDESKRKNSDSHAIQIAHESSYDISPDSHVTFQGGSCDISPLPILKNHEPSLEPSGDKFTLPDFIDSESWMAYEEMRKKIRKPLTDYARKLAVHKLADLKTQGHDPVTVLNYSILGSYQGLFAPNGNDRPSPTIVKPTKYDTSFDDKLQAERNRAAIEQKAQVA